MEQIAFKMQLKPGHAAEYQRRHDAIWPELSSLLKEAGISDYSIFLDQASGALFGVLRRSDGHRMATLAQEPVMQRWWTHMADLMETHSGNEPVSIPLLPVFHLP